MLTSKQRATLRAQANGLDPVFQIGKNGIDDELVKATVDCLNKRELIKLRMLETSPHTTREAADELARLCRCDVVQVIGYVIVLFKRKPKESAFAEVLKR